MNWGEIAQQRLNEIANCSDAGPGVTRFPFTAAHHAALGQIRDWMRHAGLTPDLDAAGTLVGRRGGQGARVLLGSHQDSVRHAGRYDGIMGIALACLALEKLRHEQRVPRYPVEVLAFADEEGVRFPTALLGPRALAGTVDPRVFQMTDGDGLSLGQVLDAFGGDQTSVAALARHREDIRAYLEVHIEQGPVLETRGAPLGVVTAICGIERNTVTFLGETGHAGTVPMASRTDAFVAAADFVRLVHDEARAEPEVRATIGTCTLSPNVANGIPDLCNLTLEIRAPDDQARHRFSERMKVAASDCAAHRGGSAKFERTYEQAAVPCAPGLIDMLAASVTAQGQAPVLLPSGATHDASAMSDLCDIAMLFVRCAGGISHRPEEFANTEDMGVAVGALAEMLTRLDAESGTRV